jgi:cob(I)alamin adenosyltransferase
MTHRLTEITTKGGDDGTTGIVGGTRLKKNDIRIVSIGEVDELNSLLGVVGAELVELAQTAALRLLLHRLKAIQHDLFDLGAELAMPGETMITSQHIDRLEQWLAGFNATLAPLENFILPGGSRSIAYLQLARSVCRRAERQMVALMARESGNPASCIYLNRLSDLLFVAARWLAHTRGEREYLWEQN